MWTLLLIAILFLTGCSSSDKPIGPNADPTQVPPSTSDDTPAPEQPDSTPTPPDDSMPEPDTPMRRKWIAAGYTYQRPDGNRMALGTGSLPAGTEIEIPLSGSPQWVVAAPIPEGSIWAVALSDGRVQAFKVTTTQTESLTITPDILLPGTPPLLVVDDQGQPALANPTDAEASTFTNPALLTPEGRIAYIDNSGDLVIRDGDVDFHLPINALPDARILMDEEERILLLTNPTSRYGHGVLGDDLEAAGIALIETRPTPQVVLHIDIPAPAVVEGLSPIWTDLTGDGRREILVTLSDEEQGAASPPSTKPAAGSPPARQSARAIAGVTRSPWPPSVLWEKSSSSTFSPPTSAAPSNSTSSSMMPWTSQPEYPATPPTASARATWTWPWPATSTAMARSNYCCPIRPSPNWAPCATRRPAPASSGPFP